jgi:hypothetical protein
MHPQAPSLLATCEGGQARAPPPEGTQLARRTLRSYRQGAMRRWDPSPRQALLAPRGGGRHGRPWPVCRHRRGHQAGAQGGGPWAWQPPTLPCLTSGRPLRTGHAARSWSGWGHAASGISLPDARHVGSPGGVAGTTGEMGEKLLASPLLTPRLTPPHVSYGRGPVGRAAVTDGGLYLLAHVARHGWPAPGPGGPPPGGRCAPWGRVGLLAWHRPHFASQVPPSWPAFPQTRVTGPATQGPAHCLAHGSQALPGGSVGR